MVLKFASVIFIIWYIGVTLVTTQDCSYSRVVDLLISDDGATLIWVPSPQTNCTIEYYLIAIQTGYDPERVYNATGTRMDISFLPKCEFASFIIRPVSPEGVQGLFYLLMTDLPLPTGSSMNLTYLRLSPVDEGVFLEWDIDDEWKTCAKYFRVEIHDEVTDSTIHMIATNKSISAPNLLPCTSYDIGVKAVYSASQQGTQSVVKYTTPADIMSAPTLANLTLGTTSVELTWNLQEYSRNRCAVSSLIVDSSPLFNITYPIEDSPDRSPVSVQVDNLQAGSLYLLNVSVYNTKGPSKPTLLAVQTLDSA